MELLTKILTYSALVIAGASAVALALRSALPGLKKFAEGTANNVDNVIVRYLGYFVKAAVWLGEVVLPLINKFALNPKEKPSEPAA